jgi:hypothetical protein
MPSIGEAISLQGRSGIAEQVGKLQYQRGLAADRAAASATAKASKDITLPTGKYNRLVAPMVIKAYDEAQSKLSSLDRSQPSWQNEIPGIASEFKRKMIDLESKNLTANAIDNQTQSIDKNNVFFTNNLRKGLEIWNSSKDLDEVEQRRGKLGLTDDPYVKFHGDGTFDFTGNKKIDVEKDLESEAQKLTTLISAEFNSPTALGNVKTTTAKQRPWDIAASERAFGKNPSLYPEGRPASLEDLTMAYMKNNPEGTFQFAERNNIAMTVDPATGMLNQESGKKIKDAMMTYLVEFKNPTVSSKIERAPSTFNVSMGGDTERDIFESTKEKTLIAPSATNPNIKYTSIDNIGFDVVNFTVPAQQNLFNAEGERVTSGVKNDNQVAEIRVLPYGKNKNGELIMINESNKKTASGKNTIVGFMTFAMFGQPGQQYFLPVKNLAYDGFLKDKTKTKNIKQTVADMTRRTAKANAKIELAAKTGKSADEIINLFEQEYKK